MPYPLPPLRRDDKALQMIYRNSGSLGSLLRSCGLGKQDIGGVFPFFAPFLFSLCPPLPSTFFFPSLPFSPVL